MKKLIFSTALILLLSPLWIEAQTSEKGLEIVLESDQRDIGWQDYAAQVRMILRNKHGQESIRLFRFRTLEVLNDGHKTDGDKVLIIFDNPRDVKGTALLTYSHKQGDDDQWLYLSALKLVKRISARNKTGSFVGSEFAYEDIAAEEVEKYHYKWIRDETYNGQDCFVVERSPVDTRHSGYTRQPVWYDRAEYRIFKIDYFNRKNTLLKILTYNGYQKYLYKFRRPQHMDMINHQNGKSTKLEWSDFNFRTGLNQRDFNRNSLKTHFPHLFLSFLAI